MGFPTSTGALPAALKETDNISFDIFPRLASVGVRKSEITVSLLIGGEKAGTIDLSCSILNLVISIIVVSRALRSPAFDSSMPRLSFNQDLCLFLSCTLSSSFKEDMQDL